MEFKEQITNDKKMYFDHDCEKYILTKLIINRNFDNTFMDDNVLLKRARKNSNVVYNFIYSQGNEANKIKKQMILNHTKEGRKFIFDILMAQMEADLRTGYNSLGNQSRKSKNGDIVKKEDYQQNILCPEALEIYENAKGYVGVNFSYQNPFTFDTPIYDDSIGETDDSLFIVKDDTDYIRLENHEIREIVDRFLKKQGGN